jgi:hypothetical protein
MIRWIPDNMRITIIVGAHPWMGISQNNLAKKIAAA